MKWKLEKLLSAAERATCVETYRYKGDAEDIHESNLEYIGNGEFDDSEIEGLPFDESGEIDADVFLLDEEEYTERVLKDTGHTWESMYDKCDIVAMVIVRD